MKAPFSTNNTVADPDLELKRGWGGGGGGVVLLALGAFLFSVISSFLLKKLGKKTL